MAKQVKGGSKAKILVPGIYIVSDGSSLEVGKMGYKLWNKEGELILIVGVVEGEDVL